MKETKQSIFGSQTFVKLVSQNSALLALLALLVFGALRYENFLGAFNTLTVLRYNSMFALVSLGMCFVIMSVYLLSGLLSGLAGVILAAQFGAGQPIEGVGWELFAIASVVVGGTLLTGGKGSVGATLAGVLLLGLIFNILNF